MIKVLFVCTGNICRSPMAEGIFRAMVAKAGLSDQISVDSAGTTPYHIGDPAHSGTLAVLKRNDIRYTGRARQIERDDLDTFDYVLAMDRRHWSFMQRYGSGSTAEIQMFLSYANAVGTVSETDVSDPFYDGQFDRAYSVIYRGCAALFEHIREAHNLVPTT
ncbi:MAG: low molecular weight phosphotyrosine protein phosphatase [Chloroflexi bacterium]|nr:low molecular weight phosphotyrosine protein phosphatase [Chloroflexota bacterium]